jgi:zinc-binding alcohol dehydrogenase/oxidoreductase
MKAWIINTLKEWPKLKVVSDPDSEQGRSIITLMASAINHRDLWITKGMYAGIQLPAVLGSDGCGTLKGKQVIINPGWYWGQNIKVQSSDFRVLGMPDKGTFAEKISVPEEYIYDKPQHLSVEEAAAIPLAGVTAYRALITKCHPEPGNKVLITGVGGGVALFAFQFALASGCEVWFTSGSDSKIKKAMEIGGAGGVNYKETDWAEYLIRKAGGFDIIIDSAGGDNFRHFIKLCNPGGKIAVYGATHGKWDGLNPQAIFWKQLSILGATMGSEEDFNAMLDFVSEHKIYPVVDSVFNFTELYKGFERMQSGEQFGKIVFSHTS